VDVQVKDEWYPNMAAAKDDVSPLLMHRFGTAILPAISGRASPEIAAGSSIGLIDKGLRVADISPIRTLSTSGGRESQDIAMHEGGETHLVVVKREPRSSLAAKLVLRPMV
jgi:hypothetical protein